MFANLVCVIYYATINGSTLAKSQHDSKTLKDNRAKRFATLTTRLTMNDYTATCSFWMTYAIRNQLG